MLHTAKKTLFPIAWHGFAGIVGNIVLKDEKWLPWYVFGHGNFADGFENMPFTPINPRVHTWALIMAGYPIQATIARLFFEEHTPDLLEMLLHHIMQMTLSIGYISANTLPYGTAIMVLHDQSDVFIALSRVFYLLGYKVVTAVCLITTVFVWAYQRIFAFS